MAEAHQRDKPDRLCRYISRRAVSVKRLALTANGQVRYELKTPYRNGTTHVIFEPLDFIAKLAALVTKPRVNLTRFHGVFAPNSKHRVQVTPAKRGKKPDTSDGHDTDWCDKSPAERHRAMTGFCSCKIGIHAILANNLDAAPQASLQYRHRSLRTLWCSGQGHCQYRRSEGH